MATTLTVVLAACAVPSADESTSDASSAPPAASTTPARTVASPAMSPAEPSRTPSGTANTSDWQLETFGDADGMAFAHDVVAGPDGVIAVGVQFDEPLPNLGPPPSHEGRVWIWSDGQGWEDATPPATFVDVWLEHLFVRSDGALVALGTFHARDEHGAVEATRTAAWESPDGRSWQPLLTGMPERRRVAAIEHGARGYLAQLGPDPALADARSEIWFSPDGRAWGRVQTLTGEIAIGAGSEGFVVVGRATTDRDEAFAMASADGRSWVESSAPPPRPVALAPLGADWLVVSQGLRGAGTDQPATTWFSTNGVEWVPRGEVAMDKVRLDDGRACHEFPAGLEAVGTTLVLTSTLSHPCSEGGFMVHGTQRVSADASSWMPLPFDAGTPGVTGSGSAVESGIAVDGALVLVGQADAQAAFWIRER